MPVTPLSEVQAAEAAAQVSDLAKVIPTPIKRVLRNGEEVVVAPVKFRNMKRFIAAVSPLYTLITTVDRSEFNPAQVAMNHTDDVTLMLATALEKDADWVGDLDIDEVALLLTDIVEVNLDFFIQNVLPLLSGRVVGVVAALQQGRTASQTPSNA